MNFVLGVVSNLAQSRDCAYCKTSVDVPYIDIYAVALLILLKDLSPYFEKSGPVIGKEKSSHSERAQFISQRKKLQNRIPSSLYCAILLVRARRR